jgi:polyisoprenoid-binding protein YceI
MQRNVLALALAAFAVLFVLAPPAFAQQATDWTIDSSHSSAQFAVRHMMVTTVRGKLGKITGVVRYDGKDPKSMVIDATIDAAGIDTQEPKRDAHLRSADFFDVAKYPALTFKSKRVEAAGAGRLKVIGDLTMHGVTREVPLEVEGPSPEVRQGNTRRIGAMGTTKINRSDYGLTWNRAVETGGVLVGDEVTITIDIAVVRRGDGTM